MRSTIFIILLQLYLISAKDCVVVTVEGSICFTLRHEDRVGVKYLCNYPTFSPTCNMTVCDSCVEIVPYGVSVSLTVVIYIVSFVSVIVIGSKLYRLIRTGEGARFSQYA